MTGRNIDRLSAVALRNVIKKPGMHADGAGLYLEVRPGESASWTHRYGIGGKTRYMGLGPFPVITLAEARKKRDANKALLVSGVDPLETVKAVRMPTFGEAAKTYIDKHRPVWTNPKHGDQWQATIDTYTKAMLGDKPVHTITREHVIAVLEPIWFRINETAGRVRSRIETILDAAHVAHAGRDKAAWENWSNPAFSRMLRHDLPPVPRDVEHHAAVPIDVAPAVFKQIATKSGVGAMALRFLILTAARTEMARGARWGEIEGDCWTIPRMRDPHNGFGPQIGSGIKGKKKFLIPMVPEAVEIIQEMRKLRKNDDDLSYVFPGLKGPISNGTMSKVLALVAPGYTVHGFRSTFRDWADVNGKNKEIAEVALNHSRGTKTETAYLRNDAYKARSVLMADWLTYLSAG